jgi:hypothetical protein
MATVAFGQAPNTLTEAERQEGWQLLFDGRSLDGWIWSTEATPPFPSWTVRDGSLRTTPNEGTPVYLLTRESFGDFDLAFDWKTERGGNSGVKYRFQGYWVDGKLRDEPQGTGRIEPVALEYQITDDETNRDALSDPKHACGSIYEYWPADKAGPARAEVWHTSRIVAQGVHIEHWLDGRKVVDVELDSPDMQQAFRGSPRRGSSPVLAKHNRRDSPIALQLHDEIVLFRNIKIRRLNTQQ